MIKIKTDQPILTHRDEITLKVAKFWDQISEGWRTIWGPHIHHGYYEENPNLSPLAAQEKLIEKLANLVHIPPFARILDVGCGMGGSSCYLAQHFNAKITGITLSKKQVAIATEYAAANKIQNVSFTIEDALSLSSFANESFDVVWSLESCEQFYDKNLFFNQAFRVLKPGGKLMLATWCSSCEEYEGHQAKQYQKLCHAFDVPYMPTIGWYANLLKEENFTVNAAYDWTPYVAKSWDIGVSLANAYSFWKVFKMSGFRGLLFARQIKLMQKAFHENRVRYGVFLATKDI